MNGGGGSIITSPWVLPNIPLPGIGLHNPLHGRQACLKLHSFYEWFDLKHSLEGVFHAGPLP